jgi:ATP-dependent RNA helicase DDX49/DBP8
MWQDNEQGASLSRVRASRNKGKGKQLASTNGTTNGTSKESIEGSQAAASGKSNVFDRKGKSKATDDTQSAGAASALGEDVPQLKSFSELGLSPSIVRSLSNLSIVHPTSIQQLTIPHILSKPIRDVIGGAQTGSGKTLCFALPILQSLSQDLVAGIALILTPTRELATQLHEQFVAVAQGISGSLRVNCALVVGGMDQLAQGRQLSQEKPHIVIATPGRLVDLLQSNAVDLVGSQSSRTGLLGRCKYVVLDEADRLLTNSFASNLKYLFEEVLPPAELRQTLLFTATLTEAIDALAKKPTANGDGGEKGGKLSPLVCKVEQPTTTPETLVQRYVLVPSHMREPYLFHLLLHSPAGGASRKKGGVGDFDFGLEDDKEDSGEEDGEDLDYDSDDSTAVSAKLSATPTIIFVNRSNTAELLSRTLANLGIPNVALHSLLPQPQRFANLQTFRAQRVPLLVSTDVGSRGLDIPQVKCVINYDMPAHWEDYVHRVGRTARNGKEGWAVSLVTERDVELVQGIEAKIGVQLSELKGYNAATAEAKKGAGKKPTEERILEKLNKVMTAKRTAKLEMQDENFGERQERNKRKAELLNGSRDSPKEKKVRAG